MAEILAVQSQIKTADMFGEALKPDIYDTIAATLTNEKMIYLVTVSFGWDTSLYDIKSSISRMGLRSGNWRTGEVEPVRSPKPIAMTEVDQEKMRLFTWKKVREAYLFHLKAIEHARTSCDLTFEFRRGRLISYSFAAKTPVDVPPGMDKGGCA